MLDPKLHTFLLLVQCQSTTRCAELLHLTQPAVSQHIKALETAYGVKLFVKEGRRLVLTPQGQRLAQLCRRLADQYPELDRQTLLAGALFHDFGKIREFSGGIANDYTDEGRLLGHLEICVEMLAPYLEKSGLEPELQRHLKHLVLSHHGTLEFGAVRVPQTAEALVLHYADNIDAKMAQCRGLFAQLGEGESWTPYQATLGRAMHRCAQTPVEEKVEKKPRASRKSSGEDGMLSLL